jgi:hypothetical protein
VDVKKHASAPITKNIIIHVMTARTLGVSKMAKSIIGGTSFMYNDRTHSRRFQNGEAHFIGGTSFMSYRIIVRHLIFWHRTNMWE